MADLIEFPADFTLRVTIKNYITREFNISLPSSVLAGLVFSHWL
jgi:hypothetical protein